MRLLPALLLLTGATLSQVTAQPYGINIRQSNTDIVIDELPLEAPYRLERIFPSTTFSFPTHLTSATDGTDRFFVSERGGRVLVLDAAQVDPTPSVFLDISSRVSPLDFEDGFYSIAFHPQYLSNGYFFVCYTSVPDGRIVVSRFSNADNPLDNVADAASEVVFLEQPVSTPFHRGGQLLFGEDGFLYISIGDGGPLFDPDSEAQKLASWRGTVLRIDVNTPDGPKQYSIPATNPFASLTPSPSPVIVESRQANGALTTPPTYEELPGSDFANSPVKSSAAGMSGSGTRSSSNAALTSGFTVRPALPRGIYDVSITVPAVVDANAGDTAYEMNSGFEDFVSSTALTPPNAGNRWWPVRRNIYFSGDPGEGITFTETAPQPGSLFADAVRFDPVPNVLREIVAFGLRNPWRMSQDPMTGDIFIADVGLYCWEEINRLTFGANFGWNKSEGESCLNLVHPFTCDFDDCDRGGFSTPYYTQRRGGSFCAITGGFVYRGVMLPGLVGHYLFADLCSGTVFAVDTSVPVSPDRIEVTSSSGFAIATFGELPDGEVAAADFFNGGLYRLVAATPPGAPDLPTMLSEIPALFQTAKDAPAAGVIPYEPQVEFWSDGARKTRYMAIPGLDQVTYTESGGWDFPEATTLIKNFHLDMMEGDSGSARLIETRLLVRDDGAWRGFSYRWDETETDATLVTAGESTVFTVMTDDGPTDVPWDFFKSSDCRICHTPASGGALGLQTVQMNADYLYPASGVTDNQLRTLEHIDLFAAPGLPGAPATLPSMPDWRDTAEPLTDRAKAYLQANCAQCHMPGTGIISEMDLRWETPLEDMRIIQWTPLHGDLGASGARIVTPGNPNLSVLLSRVQSNDAAVRMPPLGRHTVDREGERLLIEWIQSLGPSSTSGGNWNLYDGLLPD